MTLKCGCDCATQVDPCTCGGGCSWECDSTSGTQYSCFPGCTSTPYGPSTLCESFYNDHAASSCGPCGTTIIIPNIRGNLSGLTIGLPYTFTIHFISDQSTTTTIVWGFTATATTYQTSWQPMPTPDAFDALWTVVSCDTTQP